MKNKRDKRIDGIFDYLIFHDLKEQKGYELLSKQIWFKEMFDQKQIKEIKEAFLESLVPECISVFAYPQYSADLMRCCREHFSLLPFSPSLMEGLIHLTTDSLSLHEFCSEITQIYVSTPAGTVDESKIARLKNLINDILYRISHGSDLDVSLIEFEQWDQYLNSDRFIEYILPEFYNLFYDDENAYVRGRIKERSTEKTLSEFIFCLSTKHSDYFKTKLSWDILLTFLLQEWLNAEEFIHLPKLKDQSELLQLLIRYQTETESGMLFIDEGDEKDEPLYSLENRIVLADEIEELGLEDMFDIGLEELNSDDCLITVYSSACTAFNLIGTNV